jgi:hypothetical protein
VTRRTCEHPFAVFLEADCCHVPCVPVIAADGLWIIGVDFEQLDMRVACCCYVLLIGCDLQLVDLQDGQTGQGARACTMLSPDMVLIPLVRT